MEYLKRNPFQELEPTTNEDHPIDVMVRESPPVKLLVRKIGQARKKLEGKLGEDRSPWLTLDALLNEERLAREEVTFNIGFQHGYTAGGADSLLLLCGGGAGKDPGDDYQKLKERLRVVTTRSGLSAAIVIKALIEISWGVALGISGEDGL